MSDRALCSAGVLEERQVLPPLLYRADVTLVAPLPQVLRLQHAEAVMVHEGASDTCSASPKLLVWLMADSHKCGAHGRTN
mmetsp:Transcript_23866/g.63898  ORF Transcript_23866/g.63898 Transcript_23866/m.63898 type:complete len:80 (-) Transcript_23866:29-268(-)